MATETCNAIVDATMLGIEDHGIMTFMLYLKFPNGGVGFGGYALDDFDVAQKRRKGTAFGCDAILRVLETLCVQKWEDLPGTHVRVEHEGLGGGVVRIGHFMEDRWLNLKELVAEHKKA